MYNFMSSVFVNLPQNVLAKGRIWAQNPFFLRFGFRPQRSFWKWCSSIYLYKSYLPTTMKVLSSSTDFDQLAFGAPQSIVVAHRPKLGLQNNPLGFLAVSCTTSHSLKSPYAYHCTQIYTLCNTLRSCFSVSIFWLAASAHATWLESINQYEIVYVVWHDNCLIMVSTVITLYVISLTSCTLWFPGSFVVCYWLMALWQRDDKLFTHLLWWHFDQNEYSSNFEGTTIGGRVRGRDSRTWLNDEITHWVWRFVSTKNEDCYMLKAR